LRYRAENTDRQTNGGKNPNPVTAVGVGNHVVIEATASYIRPYITRKPESDAPAVSIGGPDSVKNGRTT